MGIWGGNRVSDDIERRPYRRRLRSSHSPRKDTQITQGRTGRRLRAITLTIAVFAAVAAWWTLTATAALRPASAVQGRATLAVRAVGISPAGGLTSGANLAAGDAVQRQLGITNVGSKPVAAAAVVVQAAGGSRLSSDLTVQVDRCSAAWVASGKALVCHGTQTTLSGWFAPSSRQIALAVAGLKPNATAWLRVTVKLAAGASAAQQGVQTTLTYTFSAS